MKLAFTTLACPTWDLGQIVEAATAFGYDGVDFRGYKGQMNLYELPEFTTGLAATVAQIRKAGLDIPCLSSGARMFVPPKDLDAQLDQVGRYCQMASAAKARFVRVFGGGLAGATWGQAVPAAAENLAKMARIAQAAGVTLVVETHDDWIHTEHLGQVMRQAAGRHVGVLWDVHHPYRLAGEGIEQTYTNIAPWVRYTHVKDSRPGGAEGFQYVLPGLGDVPLGPIVKLLAQGGYKGYLTVEWEKAWHPEVGRPGGCPAGPRQGAARGHRGGRGGVGAGVGPLPVTQWRFV